MPQTEEHLQILSYFGVRRAVVSLTKADLAEDEAAAVADVRERLTGSVFADAPIVPTSVVDRHGARHAESDAGARAVRGAAVTRHRQAEAGRRSGVHAARSRHRRDRHAWPEARFSAARRWSFNRAGTPARIRRIQSHGRDVEASGPGTRTALNLADVDRGRRRSSRRCHHAAGHGRLRVTAST